MVKNNSISATKIIVILQDIFDIFSRAPTSCVHGSGIFSKIYEFINNNLIIFCVVRFHYLFYSCDYFLV